MVTDQALADEELVGLGVPRVGDVENGDVLIAHDGFPFAVPIPPSNVW
jgi:hypothetical protein